MRELSNIEAPSRSMPVKSPFLLATHFYIIESWFTPVHCRLLILSLLMFILVLCFAACLRSSTKEREVWRRPLVYPSSVPVIGHLLLMGWDSSRFLSTVVSVTVHAHGLHTAHLLTLLIQDLKVEMLRHFSNYSSQTCMLFRVPKTLERFLSSRTCIPRCIDLFLFRPCVRCRRMRWLSGCQMILVCSPSRIQRAMCRHISVLTI